MPIAKVVKYTQPTKVIERQALDLAYPYRYGRASDSYNISFYGLTDGDRQQLYQLLGSATPISFSTTSGLYTGIPTKVQFKLSAGVQEYYDGEIDLQAGAVWTPSSGINYLSQVPSYLSSAFPSMSGRSININDFSYVNALTNLYENGLVGYWPFEEGSGTTTRDASGNGNTGTLVNGPTWVSGKFGGALQFSSSYVSTSNIVSGLASNNPFTLSAWFYRNTIPSNYVDTMFGTRGYSNTTGDPTTNGLIIYVDNYNTNNGVVAAKIGDGSTYTMEGSFGGSGNFVPLQVWTLITITNDVANQQLVLYLNGQLIGYFPYSGKTWGDVFPFTIGAGYGGTFSAYAIIDDFRIYNRALSASEIQQLYLNNNIFSVNQVSFSGLPIQLTTQEQMQSLVGNVFTLINSDVDVYQPVAPELTTWDLSLNTLSFSDVLFLQQAERSQSLVPFTDGAGITHYVYIKNVDYSEYAGKPNYYEVSVQMVSQS